MFLSTFQIDSEGLRSHLYEGTDVFLVCFSVVRPESMESAEERWLPDIKQNYPDVPVVVIGTQTDLRENQAVVQFLKNECQTPVSYAQGTALAKRHGAKDYLEVSPFNQKKLRQLLDRSLTCVLSYSDSKRRKIENSGCKLM